MINIEFEGDGVYEDGNIGLNFRVNVDGEDILQLCKNAEFFKSSEFTSAFYKNDWTLENIVPAANKEIYYEMYKRWLKDSIADCCANDSENITLLNNLTAQLLKVNRWEKNGGN